MTFQDPQPWTKNVKRSPRVILQMLVVQLKALLNAAWKVAENVCTFLLGFCIVIGGPDDKEPVAQQSSKVPWGSKILTNRKIQLMGNVLKLNKQSSSNLQKYHKLQRSWQTGKAKSREMCWNWTTICPAIFKTAMSFKDLDKLVNLTHGKCWNWTTSRPAIFKSTMSFKNLDKLEKPTHGKCVQIEQPVAQRSSKVLWGSKILTNWKI